jgi:hypothetical protein
LKLRMRRKFSRWFIGYAAQKALSNYPIVFRFARSGKGRRKRSVLL